jgi:hypothetical protein
MKKIRPTKIKYASFCFVIYLFCLHSFSLAQTKKSKESVSYFKGSGSYLSNAVYNGRQDSLITPYITPSVGYYDKSGFYAAASLSYLSNSSGSRIDLFSLDAGYDFSLNDQWSGSVYAEKSFYNQSSTAIQSDIKGSLGGNLTYDFGLLQCTAGTDLLFAKKADISANFGLAHAFTLGEEGSLFTISPTVFANLSTLHFYEGYTNRKAGKKAAQLIPNLQSVEAITTVNNNKFTLLDYELSLPITYDGEKMGFYITPTYAIPQNPIYTTTTTTIKLRNGTQTSQTVDSTPQAEKNLQNNFYLELGFYIKF